jgi:hypothetical protein
MTALLDGMGKTMNSVREEIMNLPENERPARCVFIFITDGHENASQEYTRETVFQMIQGCEESEDINYDFIFLGANQDAIAAGGSFGIRAGASMNYAANAEGSKGVYESLTKGVTSYRTSSNLKSKINFDSEDRAKSIGNHIIPDFNLNVDKE